MTLGSLGKVHTLALLCYLKRRLQAVWPCPRNLWQSVSHKHTNSWVTAELPILCSPVGAQVDAADAQVVARADISRLELQCPTIRGHSFFTPIAVGQGGTELVPQKVVLEEGAQRKG